MLNEPSERSALHGAPRSVELESARLGGDWQTERRSIALPGVTIERVSSRNREPFSFGFSGPCGLLSLNERGYRNDGETSIAGLPPVPQFLSRRRNLGGLLVYVPPGVRLTGWSVPSIRSSWLNIYLGPTIRSLDGLVGLDALALEPRIHFVDSAVRSTMEKLRGFLDRDAAAQTADQCYAEMLAGILVAELGRAFQPSGSTHRAQTPSGTGHLSRSREALLRVYIEERLAEPLSVACLAELVGLSPLHLVRTFKRTIGVPPHRYILSRRIERAKQLLAHPANSVTDVALAAGFGSSSHFSQVFRSATGMTPSQFRASC